MSGLLPVSTTVGVAGVTGPLVLAYLAYAVVDARKAKLLGRRTGKMMTAVVAFWALYGVAIAFEVVGTDGTVPAAPAVVAGALALAFTWCGSWFMNDVFDKETDKHANAHRATAKGEVSDREAFVAASALCLAGLAYGAAVNRYALAGAAWMVTINLLYSVPPIRLKSGAFTSMLSAGLMGVAGVLLGSATVTSAPTEVSIRLAAVVFVFMALNMSYKDLKDAEHDAKTGVENFVVKLGRERATRFLMASFPVSYVVGGVLLGVRGPVALAAFFALGGVAAGILHFSDTSSVSTLYRIDLVNASYLVTLMAAYAGFVW